MNSSRQRFGVAFGALIADKAFDANTIIADLDARGAKVVISQHPHRSTPLAIDMEMYKWRHLIVRRVLPLGC